MSAYVIFSSLLFILADSWALYEPPIYYDRNHVLPSRVPERQIPCWEEGGICTSLARCPTEHILNLPVLGDLCGESGDSVCCSHILPTDKHHVDQVAACNEKKAFCTWDSLCPPESRVEGPLLCDGQEGVSCCSTGLAKKRSLGGFFTAPAGARSAHQKGFIKLRASGSINALPDQLEAGGAGRTASKFTVDAVSIAKKNAQQENGNEGGNPGSDSESTSGSPVNPASFGAVEKSRGHAITEENCFQKGGLCVQRELCPPEDQLGPHDLCGFQNFYACCKPSSLPKPQPEIDDANSEW